MARASKYEDKKDELLGLVAKAQIAHGRPPSVRDLAEALDVGVATAHSYVAKLSDEGLVEWSSGRHRTLRCTGRGLEEAQ